MPEETKKPVSIVIAGAGFAGIYAYLAFHNLAHGAKHIKITIINETDYFLFVPLIHEVATGNLLATSIVQPIWSIPRCCMNEFIEGAIQEINYDKKIIRVRQAYTRNSNERIVAYDHMLLGLGSETNFYGIQGAKKHALTLKNIPDALSIKKRIIEQFEEANCAPPDTDKRAKLRFVIVGGGPTGIELAGEIADYINGEFKRAFPHLHRFASIVLLHNGPHLVPQVDQWFSDKTKKILSKKRIIEIKFNESVSEVSDAGVTTAHGFIPSETVMWTAGVKARSLPYTAAKPIEFEEKTERIKVNNLLQIPSYPDTFVAGDQAWIYNKETHQPYPMRAQFAFQEGIRAAKNIIRITKKRPLREFSYNEVGVIFSLGKGGAIGKVFGIRWTGPFAWWMYRTAYLFRLVGFRAKLRTALEWTINLFSRRDITKL